MLKTNETSVWEFREHDLSFVSNQLLMNTPTTVFITWTLYIIFILKIGPKFMKNRPAYNLNGILMVYNAVQVALSVFVLCLGVPILFKHGLNPICYDNKGDTIGYLKTIHVYYLLKVTELLDTVFFVLRKKFNQASFLHIYHHSYMVLSTWLIVRFDPTYAVVFPGMINSFIHVIMYTYYGLSAYPSLARYLWWKKYITSMQLIQFVMIIIHLLRSYHYSKCPPTFLMAYSKIANCTLFIILFSDFYIKSYRNNKKSDTTILNSTENCVNKENGKMNGRNTETNCIDNRNNEFSKDICNTGFTENRKKIL